MRRRDTAIAGLLTTLLFVGALADDVVVTAHAEPGDSATPPNPSDVDKGRAS